MTNIFILLLSLSCGVLATIAFLLGAYVRILEKRIIEMDNTISGGNNIYFDGKNWHLQSDKRNIKN